LFIPEHKLTRGRGVPAPLALIAQSGALAVARASKLEQLDPRYLITVGNQLDLTVADYLAFLKGEEDLALFVCYVEGFAALEGRRWLDEVAAITAAGRQVILYRAGRSEAGVEAARSHTAAVAGDYEVTCELARAAGAIVAESLADLEDLIPLCLHLGSRPPAGWRLGALSNAGFECVAIADNLGPLQLARLTVDTMQQLQRLLRDRRLETIVDVRNPLDLTPIADDRIFARAAGLILEDPGVDLGLIGCVPLSAALQTLPPGAGHDEDLGAPGAVARHLVSLAQRCAKPWVAVIDAGPRYDPLARFLGDHGIPTFRSADRAMRLLQTCCRARPTSRSSGPASAPDRLTS
jgi:acyl-CoA synthetase (NDP forming)